MLQRFLPIILISSCLLAGCSRVTEEESKLIGQWQIANAESVSGRVGSEDDIAASARMSVEFQSGGQFITQTKMGSIDSIKEGTWKVISYDSANAVLTIECDLQMQQTQCEIKFVKPDEIDWIPPNMAGTTQEIRFRKSN